MWSWNTQENKGENDTGDRVKLNFLRVITFKQSLNQCNGKTTYTYFNSSKIKRHKQFDFPRNKKYFNQIEFLFFSLIEEMVAALTKDNSKANIAGVVDTINKRVSGKVRLFLGTMKEERLDLFLFFFFVRSRSRSDLNPLYLM